MRALIRFLFLFCLSFAFVTWAVASPTKQPQTSNPAAKRQQANQSRASRGGSGDQQPGSRVGLHEDAGHPTPVYPEANHPQPRRPVPDQQQPQRGYPAQVEGPGPANSTPNIQAEPVAHLPRAAKPLRPRHGDAQPAPQRVVPPMPEPGGTSRQPGRRHPPTRQERRGEQPREHPYAQGSRP